MNKRTIYANYVKERNIRKANSKNKYDNEGYNNPYTLPSLHPQRRVN